MELLFKIVVSAIAVGACFAGLRWIWSNQIDVSATIFKLSEKITDPPEWLSTRDPNKIYQQDRPVGDVTGHIQTSAESIVFAQLANTATFNPAQPFEYRRQTLRVSRVQRSIGMKTNGRQMLIGVLEGVTCEIIK